MEAFEQRLAQQLAEPGERSPRLPPDFPDRVRIGAARRRRRRHATVVGLAAIAVAVAVLVPELILSNGHDRVEHARPGPAITSLGTAFPDRTPVTIKRNLNDGWKITALALTDDGRILYVREKLHADFHNEWSDGLFLYDPRARASTTITSESIGVWAGLSQIHSVVPWLGHVNPAHKHDLLCHDPVTGTDHQISDGSVWESTVRVSGDLIAWSYYALDPAEKPIVQVAQGCTGTPRDLGVHGAVLDLHGPYVYVNTSTASASGQPPASLDVVRVDVRTGAIQPVRSIEPTDDEGTAFAATDRDATWVGGRSLMHRVLPDGQSSIVVEQLPTAKGDNGEILHLTAGDRIFAFGTSPSDGNPSLARGLVYDPARNLVVELPGEAIANDRWLLWRDGDTYRLLDVG